MTPPLAGILLSVVLIAVIAFVQFKRNKKVD